MGGEGGTNVAAAATRTVSERGRLAERAWAQLWVMGLEGGGGAQRESRGLGPGEERGFSPRGKTVREEAWPCSSRRKRVKGRGFPEPLLRAPPHQRLKKRLWTPTGGSGPPASENHDSGLLRFGLSSQSEQREDVREPSGN